MNISPNPQKEFAYVALVAFVGVPLLSFACGMFGLLFGAEEGVEVMLLCSCSLGLIVFLVLSSAIISQIYSGFKYGTNYSDNRFGIKHIAKTVVDKSYEEVFEKFRGIYDSLKTPAHDVRYNVHKREIKFGKDDIGRNWSIKTKFISIDEKKTEIVIMTDPSVSFQVLDFGLNIKNFKIVIDECEKRGYRFN